jgi:hypothetical protein
MADRGPGAPSVSGCAPVGWAVSPLPGVCWSVAVAVRNSWKDRSSMFRAMPQRNEGARRLPVRPPPVAVMLHPRTPPDGDPLTTTLPAWYHCTAASS